MAETPEKQDVLHFPCDFPLKVIGENADDFEGFVLALVRKHVPDLDSNAVMSQPSSKGKYVSINMKFIAQSRAQVDDLYRDLTRHKRVKWVL